MKFPADLSHLLKKSLLKNLIFCAVCVLKLFSLKFRNVYVKSIVFYIFFFKVCNFFKKCTQFENIFTEFKNNFIKFKLISCILKLISCILKIILFNSKYFYAF